MLKDKKEIKVGQIWEVTTNSFFTSKNEEASGRDKIVKAIGNREVKLNKGEKIEIRFPFEWHFRTEDSIYFHSEPEMILNNCKLVGKIFDEIKSENCRTLREVLEQKLYTEIF